MILCSISARSHQMNVFLIAITTSEKNLPNNFEFFYIFPLTLSRLRHVCLHQILRYIALFSLCCCVLPHHHYTTSLYCFNTHGMYYVLNRNTAKKTMMVWSIRFCPMSIVTHTNSLSIWMNVSVWCAQHNRQTTLLSTIILTRGTFCG